MLMQTLGGQTKSIMVFSEVAYSPCYVIFYAARSNFHVGNFLMLVSQAFFVDAYFWSALYSGNRQFSLQRHLTATTRIHLYHLAAILESFGNKGFVFVLSLPVQPHIE